MTGERFTKRTFKMTITAWAMAVLEDPALRERLVTLHINEWERVHFRRIETTCRVMSNIWRGKMEMNGKVTMPLEQI